jgi:hypothetical protein
LTVTERDTADQCQQYGVLEAVHVLRRHGADQRAGAQFGETKTRGRGTQTLDQIAPLLAVRHRHAG